MIPGKRRIGLLCALLAGLLAPAQDIAPFTTALDHFMVFDRGRFVELEPRKPLQMLVSGERLVYTDAEGKLKVYSGEQVNTLERQSSVRLFGSDHLVAMMNGNALRLVKATGATEICPNAEDPVVQDSLIVFEDRDTRLLYVHWNGRVFPLAEIGGRHDKPQWSTGANTVVYFDHAARKLVMFYKGRIRNLSEDTDAGVVSAGGDIVAWWDSGPGFFRVFDRDAFKDLEPLRPADFSSGERLVAYTDGNLVFKCYHDGRVDRLLDHRPTNYWVRDRVVLWVDDGKWWTMRDGSPEIIEEYVPEQWAVSGSAITYLDLNREVRRYTRGEREKLSHEARIERFELYGDAVLYRNVNGTVKVAWKGKLYEY